MVTRKTILVSSAIFGMMFLALAGLSYAMGDVKGVLINSVIVLGWLTLFIKNR